MTEAKYDVTAIGLPFVDTIDHIEDTFLKRFSLEKGSCREYPPAVLSAIRNALPNPKTIAGGSPPNTCVVINQLGGKSIFLGRIADDEAGRIFRTGFRESDVIFPNQPHRSDLKASSGIVILMVTPDGKTTIAASPGVGRKFNHADIFPDYIRQSKILFVQSELLSSDVSGAAIDRAITIAKDAGREVAISLNGEKFTEKEAVIFRGGHLSKGTIANGNRAEFDSLFRPFTPYGLEEKDQLLIVTNREKGADIVGRGKRLHIPAHPPRKFVNKIGAGDTYIGAFLFAYLRGLDLQSCGEMAAEAASAILEIPGGRPNTSLMHIARKNLEIGTDIFPARPNAGLTP